MCPITATVRRTVKYFETGGAGSAREESLEMRVLVDQNPVN